MSNQEIYDQTFMELFGLSADQLGANLAYQSIPEWDSVGHMSLMAQLEESFNIMMDTDDIIDFSSYNTGKEILEKYNVVI